MSRGPLIRKSKCFTRIGYLRTSSPEMTKNSVHSLPADAREAVEEVEVLIIGPKRTQIEEIPNLESTLIQ